MNQQPPTDEQKRTLIVGVIRAIIPFVAPRYGRWLELLASTVISVALAVAFIRVTDIPTPYVNDQYVYASAILADMRDVDLKINKRTKRGTVIRTTSPLSPGDSSPAAPVMNWENADIRNGRPMVWCLSGMDPIATGYWRDVLNELATNYPPPSAAEIAADPTLSRAGVVWRESCSGHSYTVGNTATTDCGGAPGEVVACAVYEGNRAGRVSIAQEFLTRYSGLRDWRKVAMAHEGQHIILNLGHNACGVVRDPLDNKAVPSVMTPVVVESGRSCSDPPATGLVSADHYYAIGYYKLRPRGDRPPPPAPTPSPTPSPTPTPRGECPVVAREWIEAWRTSEGQVWPDGYWRVVDTVLPCPPADGRGAHYSIGVRQPDGSIEWRTEFPRITP